MKKAIRMVIVAIIMAGLIVGYYYYLSHRNTTKAAEETTEELTEIEDILTTDLENDYPPSPREVIKFYDRIVSCYYSGECSKEDITNLSQVQWALLDPQLQEINPIATFADSVNADIEQNQEMKRSIINVTVCSSLDVEYKTVQGDDIAIVYDTYFMKEGSSFENTKQQYALRQDEDKKWRIIAFDLSNVNTTTED
ncbi:DUF6715 family protein [Eubacterium oxidoreducens]|uniref:Uncharacterized protein n=1 Tax=Eubacterium oxidoreducens TaxID=1732 RepID=A0A1G6CUK5_EUBOX|nr:DUF6715 family protein [Eubacterium oxidoreducens]SDB36540.1 hypothetical protein SAMN02910417_02691 [Eubacterium oxidoreducens]